MKKPIYELNGKEEFLGFAGSLKEAEEVFRSERREEIENFKKDFSVKVLCFEDQGSYGLAISVEEKAS